VARTLAQAQELTQDMLVKGVIEELIKTEEILRLLPFKGVVGSAYAYNREDEDNPPSVGWYNVGDTLVESTGQTEQITTALKILIGQADTDLFVEQTMSNINEQHALDVQMVAKAMAHEFLDVVVYGDEDSDGFDGLHVLCDDIGTANCTVNEGAGTTPAALSLAHLDEAIDMVTAGKPDVILCNKTVRRRLTQYLRTVGSYLTERDEYGNLWMVWQGIPIVASDWIVQTEAISGGDYSAKTGGTGSSIFVIKFGERDGLVGLENGGIQYETFDKLESKDAMRTRLKWYVGMALHSTKSIARIDGISDAVATS